MQPSTRLGKTKSIEGTGADTRGIGFAAFNLRGELLDQVVQTPPQHALQNQPEQLFPETTALCRERDARGIGVT